MKKSFIFIVITILSFTFSEVYSQDIPEAGNPDYFEYWQRKMEDPNVNFFQLVEEFDNYWKNREITKESGYKFFRRWENTMRPRVSPAGRITSPQEIRDEYLNFKAKYPPKDLPGTWTSCGLFDYPVPLFPGQLPGNGRLSAVAFHPTNSTVIFAGAPAGGLWFTNDGGNSWINKNTDELPSLGVSDILIDYSYPSKIIIGTGDRDGHDVPGMGIFVSWNNGQTWSQMNSGLNDLDVNRLIMHPTNPDIIIAATNDGIYKTTDGCYSWYRTSGIYNKIFDIVYHPADPQYVYAMRYGLFFRSDDGGENWTRITSGISTGSRGAVAVTPAAPDNVYVFLVSDSRYKGLYVSENKGVDFTEVIDTAAFRYDDGNLETQGGYNLDIAVDPDNPDVIYAGMVTLHKTVDRGVNWNRIANAGEIHADQHVLVFSPHNGHLYIGNDGGLFSTSDGGNTYNILCDGLVISQIYRMDVSASNPDQLVCGTQDGGSYVTYGGPFYHQTGGDGMHCIIDPDNNDNIYSSSQRGHLYRSLTGGAGGWNFHSITDSINGIEEKGDWITPYLLDHGNSNTMFVGLKDIYRTTNLTTPDHTNVHWDNISAGQLVGSNIRDLKQSPVNRDLIYVADVAGRMFKSTNALAASPVWNQMNNPSASDPLWFECHPLNPTTVYMVTGNNVWKSTDEGQTWTDITLNLPDVGFRCLIYQENTNEILYLATDAGVYFKSADMDYWELFKENLPVNVPVRHLRIHYDAAQSYLFAGTYGRGIWKTEILDEYKPNLIFTTGSATVNNTEVTIDVQVKNTHPNSPSWGFKVGYFLSVDNSITASDYLIGYDSISGLNPGEMVSKQNVIDVAYVIPEIPAGIYYIGAIADYEEYVPETNENDNVVLFSPQVELVSITSSPANIQATDGTYGNKIVISWDDLSSTITYFYRVYRNTANVPASAQPLGQNWSTNTSFWDTTALDGLDYYYWVRASDNFLGLRAGPMDQYDIGWQYLKAPINVEATDGEFDDRIIISWDPSENSTHYKVWRNTTSNVNTALPLSSNWTSNTSFTDFAVTSGINYFYWVKSARSSGGSKPSPYYSDYTVGWAAFMDAPAASATDGLYTTHVEITWNTIPGASYYKLFQSYTNDPATSSPITAWTTSTSKTHSPVRGVYSYYWVKAATTITGNMETGFGQGDAGWRKLEAVQNVNARDGESADHIRITWNNQTYADYYKVYRSTINASFSNAIPITTWIEELSYNDSTAPAPQDCWYWVLCAKDPQLESLPGTCDLGWRKLFPPDVDATDGLYANKVVVTWDPVPGANSYRVFRGPGYGPFINDTLTGWSSTLNYQYQDYSAVQGQDYYYLVKAAYNNYGYKPSDTGYDQGRADECANFAEYPDPSYRGLDLRGSVLEISHRIVNNGPHASTSPVDITYYLSVNPPSDYQIIPLGTVMMPPLGSGQYFENTFSVDLDTVPDGPVNFGTYYIRILVNGYNWNCETSYLDNVINWDDPYLVYTDAMYGEYTIGGSSPDYPDFGASVTDLCNRGVSDNVTFNVRPGVYAEQVYLPAITGVDDTRWITFRTDPSKGDTAEINYTSSTENFTLQFDGARYLVFENLKLTTPGFSNYQSNYGRVVEFKGDAKHIEIRNCLIRGTADDTFINDDAAVIICGGNMCSEILIQDNTIMNGSYGIYIESYDGGDDANYGIRIEDNLITDFLYTGIYQKMCRNPIIDHNTILYKTSNTTQSFGIELEACGQGLRINGNKLIMEPSQNVVFGISIKESNVDSPVRGTISNNFISIDAGGKYAYGISHFINPKVDVLYNSINLYGSAASFSVCAYFDCWDLLSPAWDNVVKNNIFANRSDGYAIGVGDSAVSQSYIGMSDYNDLLSTGSFLSYFGVNVNQQNLAGWQFVSGFDTHSVSLDPEFFSDTDLHTFSVNLDGKATPLATVEHDIDGDVRDWLAPDIGADEFTLPPPDYDASVYWIYSPVTGYGLGLETVQVEIANYGSEMITDFPVSYMTNGGVPVTEINTDTIWPFTFDFYDFTTQVDLSEYGTYEITAFTSLAGDERPSNDSVSTTIENLIPVNCIPQYGIGCDYGDYISDIELNTLMHYMTGCSDQGYGDFTSMSTTLMQGESYQATMNVGYAGQYAAVWIDFDDDLVFEDEEKMIDNLYFPNSWTFYWDTIHVPVNAWPGTHRLRVRCAFDNDTLDPCNYYEYGEAHDYMVNIQTGGGLSVDAGANVTACQGETVNLTAVASGGTAPYTYQWAHGANGSSIFVSALTDTVYVVYATDQSGYMAMDSVAVTVLSAPESMPSAGSPVCEGADILLYGSGMAMGIATIECQTNCTLPVNYCDSYAIDSLGTEIDEVVFNTIQNNTAGICASYSDFTGISTTVGRDSTYSLSVTSGTCDWDDYKSVRVFIDWNRDGDFYDTLEMVADFEMSWTTITQDTVVLVPGDAVLGNTLMRVIAMSAFVEDTISSCGTYWQGETEDYTVNIVDIVPNQIAGYSWRGPSGFTSLQQNPVIANASVLNEGYYVLEVYDENGCTDQDSVLVDVQEMPYADAGQDTTVCEDLPLLLSGYAGNYSSVFWSTSGTGFFDTYNTLSPSYYASMEDVQNGSVTLTLTAYAISPCIDSVSSSILVTIQGMPYIELPVSDTTCGITGYQTNVVEAIHYTTVQWQTSGTGNFSDPLALNPVYYPSQADEDAGAVDLTLTAYAIAPCVYETPAIMELLIQKEPFVFAGNDTSVCSNEPLQLITATSSGCSEIHWASSGTGTFSDTTIQNPTYYPDQQDIQAGSVVLTMTGFPVNPCTGSSVSTLTMSITPEPYSEAGGPAVICENESYFFSGSDASNYSGLLWETSGTGYFDDPTMLHPTYYPGAGETGQVIIGLWAFGNAPCADAYSNMLLDIQAAPFAYAGSDATINQGESYLIADAIATDYISLEWTSTGAGNFDDPNILNPTYTPGPGETGTVSLILEACGFSPCGNAIDTMALTILSSSYSLDIKVFLEGPFDVSSMNPMLITYMPLSQPYNTLPWNYQGSESVTSIPNSFVIDWILVELRDAPDASLATGATMIARKAGFVLQDGSMVDTDGSSDLAFTESVATNLFVVIWHRNHLGVMSAYPLVESGGVYSYDFTIGATQVYGSNNAHKEVGPGIWGMVGADGNADSQINNGDKLDVWAVEAGGSGYKAGDFNMDSQVNNGDKNDIWVPNTGLGGQVPEYTGYSPWIPEGGYSCQVPE